MWQNASYCKQSQNIWKDKNSLFSGNENNADINISWTHQKQQNEDVGQNTLVAKNHFIKE